MVSKFQLPAPPNIVIQALEQAENCVLTFPVNNGDLTTDDYGNQVLESTDVTFRATIIPNTSLQKGTTEYTEGVDYKWVETQGRLVCPKTFNDTGVGNQSEGTVAFNDGTTGTIKLKSNLQNPYPGTRDVLGDRFLCFLLMDRPK